MVLTISRSLTLLFVCAAISGCDKSESYRLVSEKYNFSVEFPEKPTEQMKVNDEGLPKGYWQVSRDKVVAKEYYAAEATSYKDILNPDDELVPNEQLLALNGIKMLEHHRIKLRCPATGDKSMRWQQRQRSSRRRQQSLPSISWTDTPWFQSLREFMTIRGKLRCS